MTEQGYVPGNPRFAGTRWLVVRSGCSGSGKSSLLAELARRGYQVWPEAGRQIVREQMQLGGDALPWASLVRFVDLTVSRAMGQFNAAAPEGRPAIFDRSVVDQLSGLEHAGLPVPPELEKAVSIYRYAPRVLMSPPWEAVFVTDAERPKSFADAVAEYETLCGTYARLGYEAVEVPRLPVPGRADFVEATLRGG